MSIDASAIRADLLAAIKDIPEVKIYAERIAHEVADDAATYAEDLAPVLKDPARAPHAVPGAYRASIKVAEAPDHDGMPAYKVFTELEYARFLEYGTKYIEEFAIFAKTASHFQKIYGS